MSWIKVFKDLLSAEQALELKIPRSLKYKDHRLCIVRTKEGIFAFHNECPHKRVPLSDGYCPTDKSIVCQLHSYVFDLKTGEELGAKCGGLRIFRVRSEEDGVFIQFPGS